MTGTVTHPIQGHRGHTESMAEYRARRKAANKATRIHKRNTKGLSWMGLYRAIRMGVMG